MPASISARLWPGTGLSLARLIRAWDPEQERRPAPRCAPGLDSTTPGDHQLTRDGQPESDTACRAVARRIYPIKPLEDVGQMLEKINVNAG